MRIAEIPTGDGERIVVDAYDRYVDLSLEEFNEYWKDWFKAPDAGLRIGTEDLAPLIAALQAAQTEGK